VELTHPAIVRIRPPFEEPAALEPVDDRDHEWF
jgi:hypothetical protein